ncbi:hypothetical protein OBBRIDRAFT_732332 [Obba rivulosa]|uniref:SHSP domain-containing protein n=1 Tax=Obba rivulosa TaxID=1052685 RepID=A0A8E2AS37_9APHY|nr:hypothetical protein OBBRIDRAFT_732332 [Obba rivulosa]
MAPVPPSTSLGSPLQTPVTTQPEGVTVDPVWNEIRQTKERQLAILPSKVKSLEGVASPAAVQPGAVKSNNACRGQSQGHINSVTFKESTDGRTVSATFEIPGVKKQDMHVSFRSKCLVVSWRITHTEEKKEGNVLVRRHTERNFSQTIPLPEGTKFEEIHASRDGRHLVLTYPNSRCVRVGSHAKPMVSVWGKAITADS